MDFVEMEKLIKEKCLSAEVEKQMKILEIPRHEAVEMVLEDNDIIGASIEVQEMTDRAKKIMGTIHGAGDKRKRAERKAPERKLDPIKKMIVSEIGGMLQAKEGVLNLTIDEPGEKYIHFIYEGAEYTINLVKHRTKKKK